MTTRGVVADLDTVLTELRALARQTSDGFGRLAILETAYADINSRLHAMVDRLEAIEHRIAGLERRGDFFAATNIESRTRDADFRRDIRTEVNALAEKLRALAESVG